MTMRFSILFPALSLLTTACPAPPVGNPPDTGSSDATSGTTASTTTPEPDSDFTSTSTSTSTSTPDPDTSATAGSSTGPGGLGEGEECDLYLQECAPGLKCMPYSNDGDPEWEATACFPIVPDPADLGESCQWVGEPWSGYDDCGWAQVCWGSDGGPGVCKGLCLNDDPENDDYQTYACEDPLRIPYIGCQGCFCVCETPCDPLEEDCDEDQVCVPGYTGFFGCIPDASGDIGAYGDPCEFIEVCNSGLVCLSPDAVPGCEDPSGCCSPFCDINQPNTCPGAAEGQICQPWFPGDSAPRGLEHVGVCSVPA
jgi:hypothetical protein